MMKEAPKEKRQNPRSPKPSEAEKQTPQLV
jgi:hypothetical protein